jgi:putative ABC transport system substrate-binding protein
MMKRRAFIAGLGSAAAWPLVARGQQASRPLVGYLSAYLQENDGSDVRVFRQGLSEIGFVEGRNVSIEYRWAQAQYERLPELAADLVRHNVDVIAAIGGTPVVFAAKAATSVIPIIFGVGTNPVEAGLVGSLSRPEGNLTGVTILSSEIFEKRVDLLRALVPRASVIAMLVNPSNQQVTDPETRAAENGARALGLELRVLNVSSRADIESAFTTLSKSPADALIVTHDTFIATRKPEIVAVVASQKLPTIYPWREWVEFGGLMSYGANVLDAYRLIGVYAGKVLRGAKPADLPVEQSVKFDLVLNLKVVKALGLDVPPSLLARADEVIE